MMKTGTRAAAYHLAFFSAVIVYGLLGLLIAPEDSEAMHIPLVLLLPGAVFW